MTWLAKQLSYSFLNQFIIKITIHLINMNKLSRALISSSALSAASLLNLLLEQPVLAAQKSAAHTNLPQSFSSNPALFICNNCAGNDRLASVQRLASGL
jgi:hypothetical protein